MAGNQCSDFGGTDLGTSLCLMPSGHAYADLITYRDGRVAVIEEASPDGGVRFAGPVGTGHVTLGGVSADSVAITREMQGAEIGDCAARGPGGVSFAALQTTYDGSEVTWGPEHYRELNRLLGWPNNQSGHAFFCSDRANAGALVVNNDGFNRGRILAAIDTLSNSYDGSLDDAHRETLLSSLRAAAGIPEPESTWDQIRNMGGYLLGGVAVFVLGGLGAHIAGKWWDGRGGGGGNGGGGGGGLDIVTLTTTVASQLVAQGWRPPASSEPSAPPAESPAETETTNSSTSERGLWTGLAIGCGIAAAVLWADDATVVGVADDPVAAVATVGAVAFLGLAVLSGEDVSEIPEA